MLDHTKIILDVGQVPIRRTHRAVLILLRDLLNIAFMPCSQIGTTFEVLDEDVRLRLGPDHTEDRFRVGCSLVCRV